MFHNFGMKALALALAALLWLSVSAQRLEQVSVRTFEVPVALIGIPRDLVLTRVSNETVSVRLRGRVSALREMSSQHMEATVNLSDARAGTTTVPTAQALNVPDGIEVLSITPPRVEIRLEPRRQKHVPIRPYFVGDLPPGYRYDRDSVTVDPEKALVSGPASLISDFNEVATERIILSGRVEPFRQRVMIVSDAPLVRVVEPASGAAFVNVIITPPTTEEPVGTDPGPGTRDSGPPRQ